MLMDDWAMFSGALTAAEIAERWDKSLTARLAANLEPNLAIFYNFNDPLPPVGGTMVRLRQSNRPSHLMLCGAPAVPLRCASDAIPSFTLTRDCSLHHSQTKVLPAPLPT